MTPEDALAEAKSGKLRPVYLLLGEEVALQRRVLEALRVATVGEARGAGEESWMASETSASTVLAAARTMPMFSSRRFVCVRGLERWDSGTPRGAGDDTKPRGPSGTKAAKSAKASPLDALADYAAAPNPTATLILAASKLDGRRKLVALARKENFLVTCAPPKGRELVSWVVRLAKERGSPLAPGVADALAELAGPELSSVEDALERVCLYAGVGATVTEEAVSASVTRLRTATTWELVDAVANRQLGLALATFEDVFEPSDRGLPLVGLLAWSTRQLARYQAARQQGLAPPEACQAAGVPPFKAQEVEQRARALPEARLASWLTVLARLDLELKGGSKRTPRASFELALMELCGAPRERPDPRARGATSAVR